MPTLKNTIFEIEYPSWIDILKPGEMLGGPSPWGNSRYSIFKKCPYLYWWYFIKRMTRLERSPPLEIGGLYHESRAWYALAWLDNTSDAGVPTLPLKELDELCKQRGFEVLNRAEKIVPEFAGEARRLYMAWLARYGPCTRDDYRDEIYGVEVLLEVDKPFKYSARIDQWLWSKVLKGPTINEIKSAGRRDSRLLKSYKMDAQFIGQQYLWNRVMKKKWGALKGFTVDLVTKGRENLVDPRVLPISIPLIKDWEKGMKAAYSDLIHCQMLNHWPQRQNYYSCQGRMACPAFEHCASGRKTHIGWRRKTRKEY